MLAPERPLQLLHEQLFYPQTTNAPRVLGQLLKHRNGSLSGGRTSTNQSSWTSCHLPPIQVVILCWVHYANSTINSATDSAADMLSLYQTISLPDDEGASAEGFRALPWIERGVMLPDF